MHYTDLAYTDLLEGRMMWQEASSARAWRKRDATVRGDFDTRQGFHWRDGPYVSCGRGDQSVVA